MRASVLILLGGCLCMALAATQEAPEEELTTPAIRRTFQRRKHVDLKSTNGTRRRRKKHRRPQHQIHLSSVEAENSTADVSREAEYNQRVRSFASAIKDTDTFLRFLKLEESRHMRDFVRGRDFNYNNRSLTTRFLQNPMLRTNDRAKRPTESSSVGQEEGRSPVETGRPTDGQFEPTQQFYQDVGAKFEKEVARANKNPTSRDKKRSRTARRRFENVPKFGDDEPRYADKVLHTTKQFVSTTQTSQDVESGTTIKDTISESNTERADVANTDEERKPTTSSTTFSSSLSPKQDLEPTLSYKVSTEKAETILIANEQPSTEESKKPTSKTLTTIPQTTREFDQSPSHEVNIKPSPELTAIPTLRNEELHLTIESRRPTSGTFASTSQTKGDFESRRGNEGRRSRTRTTSSRHRERDHAVDSRRKPLKHADEPTHQPNHDTRSRLDNEVTRSFPNPTPREKLRSRTSSERFENIPNTNYETRTTARQNVATLKSRQDPESRFENELHYSRSSDSWEVVRNPHREEPVSTFTTKRTTTRRYEATTLPIEYTESRSVKDAKHSRNSHDKFENVPKPSVRQQLNYDIRMPGTGNNERTTQSNYFADTRADIDLSRPRPRISGERFENIPISNNNEQRSAFETRGPTTQYERTTQTNYLADTRSNIEVSRPRPKTTERFENVPLINHNEQQSAFETRRQTTEQYERTSPSNYFSDTTLDNQVSRSRPRTPPEIENIAITNHKEQQSAFETRRPTASQFETATQSNHGHNTRFENEVQSSKTPDRFENVPYRDERFPFGETTTPHHFVSTSESNHNVGSRHNDESNTVVTRDNKPSRTSPAGRFEIVPISPEDQQSTYEIRRKTAGLFNSRPQPNSEPTFYNEVTQPSIRFVPPDYSEKLLPSPRYDTSTQDSRYDNQYRTSTPKTYRYLNDDYDDVKVPNRGLLPPIEPIQSDEDYYQSTTPQQTVRSSDNTTVVTGRRAPSSSKKGVRKPKSRNPDRYLKHPDDDYDELRLTAAESTYYKKRKMNRLPMIDTYDSQQVIPGVAGRDYSVYSAPPDSEFSCGKGHMGYFADVEAGCQVFYICTGDGRGEPMLCPNGTLFNQNVLVCDWWFNVVCSYK